MRKSVFNTAQQETNLASKIVVGLERISEAFKVLLWQHAKTIGLSPLQIQILIFIAHHKQEFANVSHLASEFNVTKPTVSDAVKVLEKKELILKDRSSADSRSFTVLLSVKGKEIVAETETFANPIQQEINKITTADLDILYNSVTNIIYGLNQSGHLSVQRMCYSCKFYAKKEDVHFCNFLNAELHTKDIRVDCPEFNQKA